MNNEEIKLLKQQYSIKSEFPNRIYYICEICGKELYRFKSQISTDSKSHHYCCKEHYALGLKIQMKGKNNPNWNHKWNEAQRKHQSEIVTENFKNNPELRYKCGATNRGKTKDTCEHLKRAAEKRKEGIASGRIDTKVWSHPVSEERKIQIGIEHKAYMNDPKTKAYYRKMWEERGKWLPLSEKPSQKIYYQLANWIASMFSICSESEAKLIEKYGIFNQTTNTKGVVRDHIYSRKSGFLNKVFPEILRHPCNCQIITHAENVSKAQKGNQDADSQTLEELFEKIKQYTKPWIEQDICLDRIKRYKSGERWIDPYKNNR